MSKRTTPRRKEDEAASTCPRLTVGSGFKGGEFIPLVFIGATLGSALSVWLPASVGLLCSPEIANASFSLNPPNCAAFSQLVEDRYKKINEGDPTLIVEFKWQGSLRNLEQAADGILELVAGISEYDKALGGGGFTISETTSGETFASVILRPNGKKLAWQRINILAVELKRAGIEAHVQSLLDDLE